MLHVYNTGTYIINQKCSTFLPFTAMIEANRFQNCPLLGHLEMWANAQHDGRHAEYRWCPLFNAAKFGSHPLLECHAVMLGRRESSWNLQVCPKLPDRSQPLVSRSSLYCGDMWRRYCCLTVFFQLSIRALVAKYSLTKLCDGAQMATFCILNFQRATCSKFQTCIVW